MTTHNHINDLEQFSIAEINDYGNNKVLPKASVVIVTYNTNKSLLSQNLNSLKEQTIKDFEILVVDNNDKIDIHDIVSNYDLKYIKLNRNYGLTIARNIGIINSKGKIIIFLDDDAIPADNFVKEHIQAYNEYDILGLRGISLPRTSAIYNYLASHYDLGVQAIPWIINLEGNSSFKKDALIKVGGFNPELQGAGGHEGLELTYRIVREYQDKNKLIYYPKAVIYHDYSDSFCKYLKKQLRHDKYANFLKYQFPELFQFASGYEIRPQKMNKDDRSLFIRIKLMLMQKLVSFILLVQHASKRLITTEDKWIGKNL